MIYILKNVINQKTKKMEGWILAVHIILAALVITAHVIAAVALAKIDSHFRDTGLPPIEFWYTLMPQQDQASIQQVNIGKDHVDTFYNVILYQDAKLTKPLDDSRFVSHTATYQVSDSSPSYQLGEGTFFLKLGYIHFRIVTIIKDKKKGEIGFGTTGHRKLEFPIIAGSGPYQNAVGIIVYDIHDALRHVTIRFA